MSALVITAASMVGAAAGVWIGFNLCVAIWARRFREIAREEIRASRRIPTLAERQAEWAAAKAVIRSIEAEGR